MPTAAQNGNVLTVLDVELPTAQGVFLGQGSFGNLGVASFFNASGTLEFHVSSAGTVNPVTGNWTGTNNPPHTIFVFDQTGAGGGFAFQRSYTQPLPSWPPGANASGGWQWGFRDGANDQKFTGNANPQLTSFFWGNEDGIWIQDQNGGLKNNYAAEAGIVAAPSVPIKGPGLAQQGNYRAQAYNPKGDPRGVPVAVGRGSWFSGNFGAGLVEVDNGGNILNNFPNNSGWSIYGLAWDPTTEMLWANSSPNSANLVEIDPVTGLETGKLIWAGPGQGANPGAQGGLDIVLNDSTICQTILGPGRQNGGTTLVALQQGGPDSLYAHILDYDTDDGSTNPASPATLTHTETGSLEVGVNGAVAGDTGAITDADVTADIALTDTTGNDAAGVLHINLNADVTGAAVLPPLLLGLDHVVCGWSLRASSLLTNPGGVDIALPLTPNTNISIPVAKIPPSITAIGAQALVVSNPLLFNNFNVLPVYASNRVKFDTICASSPGLPAAIGVTVKTSGTNSFNQNTATGFFSITNNSAFPIITAELAFPPQFTNGWFDTDNPNMGWPGPGGVGAPTYANHQTAGDIPFPNNLGNNGASIKAPGCAGTWRNGSEILTGVIFGRAGEQPVEACAQPLGATGTGFTAGVSEPWRVGDSMTAVNFAFAPGQFLGGATAEWDGDTDGRGVSGSAHAGLRVDITFAGILPNGSNGTWCALLVPDALDPNEANASR